MLNFPDRALSHGFLFENNRMSGLQKLGIMGFTVWWVWNLVRTYLQIPHLRDIQVFYQTVLGISDVINFIEQFFFTKLLQVTQN